MSQEVVRGLENKYPYWFPPGISQWIAPENSTLSIEDKKEESIVGQKVGSMLGSLATALSYTFVKVFEKMCACNISVD
jgi:hypothetical protein